MAPLQPVRRHPHPHLRVRPVRRAADLRRARVARPAPARGGRRSRRKPVAGLPEGDTAAFAAGRHRRLHLRLHPDDRRVLHAAPRRWRQRNDVRERDRGPVRAEPQLAERLGPLLLPARHRGRPDGDLRPLPHHPPVGDRLAMDIATSTNGKRVLIGWFGVLLFFLYAPLLILLVFSFNDNNLPVFPLRGFTTSAYEQFLANEELRGSVVTSAKIAAISSVGAVLLGLLAAIVLVRRHFFGRAALSALLLSPLVVPYIALAIGLLIFFNEAALPLGIKSVVMGHIVL